MNITFIGMSGAGKSVVGETVARLLGFYFYDVDREMEFEYGQSLQEILDGIGEEEFLHKQAQQVLKLKNVDETVIAPGGSVVYTPDAMEHLRDNSSVVYLNVSCDTAKERLELTNRGIVGLRNKTFEDIYDERIALYEKYAHIVVKADDKTIEQVVSEVLGRMK